MQHSYSYPFFFFGVSSSCISNNPHPKEALTTNMPVINNRSLSSNPSNIEDIIIRCRNVFCNIQQPIRELVFPLLLTIHAAKINKLLKSTKLLKQKNELRVRSSVLAPSVYSSIQECVRNLSPDTLA